MKIFTLLSPRQIMLNLIFISFILFQAPSDAKSQSKDINKKEYWLLDIEKETDNLLKIFDKQGAKDNIKELRKKQLKSNKALNFAKITAPILLSSLSAINIEKNKSTESILLGIGAFLPFLPEILGSESGVRSRPERIEACEEYLKFGDRVIDKFLDDSRFLLRDTTWTYTENFKTAYGISKKTAKEDINELIKKCR